MTSPLKAARDTIATVWEALTPPTDTARGYHHLDGKREPSGSSARRCFWFDPPAGSGIVDQGGTLSRWRSTIVGHVLYPQAGRSTVDAFDELADEAMQLALAVNNRSTTFGSGVDIVEVTGWEVGDTTGAGDETREIRLTFAVETQET